MRELMKSQTHLQLLSRLFLIASITTSVFAHAEVYKSIGKDGRAIYTDRPTPNSEKVPITTPNTIKSVTVPNIDEQESAPKPYEYKQLAITKPIDNDVIPNGLVPFDISLNVDPQLQPEHQIQLLIDGTLYASSLTNSFRVNSISRGQHTLQTLIVDSSGKRLTQSKVVRVFAYRP